MNSLNKTSVVMEHDGITYIEFDQYEICVNAHEDVSQAYSKQSNELRELKELIKEDASLKICCIVFLLLIVGGLLYKHEYIMSITGFGAVLILLYSLKKTNKDLFV